MMKAKKNYNQVSIEEYIQSKTLRIKEGSKKVSNGWVYSELKF